MEKKTVPSKRVKKWGKNGLDHLQFFALFLLFRFAFVLLLFSFFCFLPGKKKPKECKWTSPCFPIFPLLSFLFFPFFFLLFCFCVFWILLICFLVFPFLLLFFRIFQVLRKVRISYGLADISIAYPFALLVIYPYVPVGCITVAPVFYLVYPRYILLQPLKRNFCWLYSCVFLLRLGKTI